VKPVFNWAHRGASGDAPENTLAAFRAAAAIRADGIECDVRASRDGTPVIFHDPTLKRIAGRPDRIAALSLTEIKAIDAGAWFSSRFSHETIPTLQETLAATPASVRLNLEIKSACVPAVIEQIVAMKATDRVILSAFDHRLLHEARRLHPTLALGVLVNREPWDTAIRTALRLHAVSLNVPRARVSASAVARTHRAGLEVHCYTVDAPDEMMRMMALGVDGLFTNHPDRCHALRIVDVTKLGERDDALAKKVRRGKRSPSPTG